MAYSKLFLAMLVLLAGACSNEAPTYNPGTAGATAGTSGGGSGGPAGSPRAPRSRAPWTAICT